MTMTVPNPLLVLDFETTGLRAHKAYPIQIGGVIMQPGEWHVPSWNKFERDIRIRRPWMIFQKGFWEAHAVNKIPPERIWRSGEPPRDITVILQRIKDAHPKIQLAGHNIGFDHEFLKRLYDLAGVENPFPHRLVDLSTLGTVHLGVSKLHDIARALDINPDAYPLHTALGDADLTAECFLRLFRRLENAGLNVWETRKP